MPRCCTACSRLKSTEYDRAIARLSHDLEVRDVAAKRTRGRRSFGAVRKLPSGRYQASYLDPAGTAPCRPGDVHSEDGRRGVAGDAAGRDRERLLAGQGRPHDRRGVRPDEWVKALQVRDRTRYHYKVNLDKWIKPTFGTVPMARDPRDGRKGGFPGHTSCTGQRLRVLSQLFRAAVEDGIVTESPVRVKGPASTPKARDTPCRPRCLHARRKAPEPRDWRSFSAPSAPSDRARCSVSVGAMSILGATRSASARRPLPCTLAPAA